MADEQEIDDVTYFRHARKRREQLPRAAGRGGHGEAELTDRPILFSAPMVRALLEGRKTMTRRILRTAKPYPGVECEHGYDACPICDAPKPPRFAAGDRLWVREAFSGPHDLTGVPPRQWVDAYFGVAPPVHYWAAGNPEDGDWTKPKPGIHMPRAFSRLTLIVTGVKVERVQDISATEALAEGIWNRREKCADGIVRNLWFGIEAAGCENDPYAAYSHLWDSINNPKGYCADDAPNSWEANPWVAAISFRTIKANIDSVEAAA